MYMTPITVAEKLNIKIKTLSKWRCYKKNLPFYKDKNTNKVFYLKSDVDFYIKNNFKCIKIINNI